MYCFKFSYEIVKTGCEYLPALTVMQETKESHDLIEMSLIDSFSLLLWNDFEACLKLRIYDRYKIIFSVHKRAVKTGALI